MSGSITGPGFINGKEERDLNLLGRAEVGSKIAAGLLALTYVSGYLIATTYLGTYGISADASGFLRAKYIYIGCQYLMFIACFGVIARFIGMLLGAPWSSISGAPWPSISEAEQEWIFKAVNAELDDRDEQDRKGNSWRQLRWVIVVALIVSLFGLEIMLVKPGGFPLYLSLQSLFLVSISLYQTTYYLEYSKQYHYSWGVLHGESLAETMRWIFGAGIPGLFALLMLISALLQAFGVSSETFTIFVKVMAGTGAAFIILIAGNFAILSQTDLKVLQHVESGWSLLWRIPWQPFSEARRSLPVFKAYFVRLTVCVLIPGVYSVFALMLLYGHDSYWLICALYYISLIWSLTVLSNIVILTLMHREMQKRLERRYSINWKNFVLTCVAATMLYVVSVFSFSFLVYPFVPFQKAGGEYLRVSKVIVHPTQSIVGCSFPSQNGTSELDQPFIMLEEDTNWTYLAPLITRTKNDPDRWGQLLFCKEKYGLNATCRPTVYAFNRRCIDYTAGR